MDERVRQTVETYEANADTYAEVHGDREGVAEMVASFLDAVSARSRRTAPPRVLDVGPGPGWESAVFADHGLDTVAVDLTRSFLEQTRDRAGAVGVCRGDMRSLPFAADSFDGLWACASLLHVPREGVPATLRGFHRVLAPGGVALVSIQRERNGRRAHDETGEAPGDGSAESVHGSAESANGSAESAHGSSVAGDSHSPYDEDDRYFELYSPEEAESVFESAGFDRVEVVPNEEWLRITAGVE